MRKTIAALLLLAAGSAYTAESPPPRREMIDKIVTIADMRTLATALEARATDTNEYPDAADMEALRPLLEPVYVRTMPARDAWSHEFLYIGGPKKQTYRIVSAGADGVFDPRSRKMSESNVQTALALSDRYEDDIIFENGTFLQVPRDALNPDELRP